MANRDQDPREQDPLNPLNPLNPSDPLSPLSPLSAPIKAELAPEDGAAGAKRARRRKYPPWIEANRLHLLWDGLSGLASLRLTVVLFALSMFLVLVGTLAQYDKDMWEVLDQYFKSWVAIVEFRVLFPPSFFPEFTRSDTFANVIAPIKFPFPGGATLGAMLALNLFAAHLIRFKVQGKGSALAWGWSIMGGGALLTALIVLSAQNSEGLQSEPVIGYEMLWTLLRGALALAWLGVCYSFVRIDSSRRIQQRLLGATALLMGALVVALVFRWDFYIGKPAMRILWQLMQGLGAGVLLLIGAQLVFKRRAGIVVIHSGVALMMVGVAVAAWFQVEERMSLIEGETTNFCRNLQKVELAVIDRSDEKVDRVSVVPSSRLVKGTTVSDEQLPFDVRFEEYYKNADLKPVKSGEENPATAGAGLKTRAVEIRAAAGADVDSEVDFPAAYVTFVDKENNSLGTRLVSAQQAFADQPEQVEVGGRTYDVYLRFKRTYRPFYVTLIDASSKDYEGTATPRDYRSKIRLVDPQRGEDRQAVIWMNNPLRYANLTFYQADFRDLGDRQMSQFQVVKNLGWMIPYVACMIVGVGLVHHFGLTLLRFLQRVSQTDTSGAWQGTAIAAPVAIAVVALIVYSGWSSSRRQMAQTPGFDMQTAGLLPVMADGRVKPLDTVARTTLRAVSDRDYYLDADGEKHSALEWLLQIASQSRDGDGELLGEQHEIVRITNLDVIETLGLDRRRKGYRFSIAELRANKAEMDKFLAEVREAIKQGPEDKSFYQVKLLETDKRIRMYTRLLTSFHAEGLEAPTPQEVAAGSPKLQAFAGALDELTKMDMPLAVPARHHGETKWAPYVTSHLMEQVFRNVQELRGRPFEPDVATQAWTNILAATREQDSDAFNEAVHQYLSKLEGLVPPEYLAQRVSREAAFNRIAPFKMCLVNYVLAFVLGAGSWLGWRGGRLTAFWIVMGTLLVHSVALYFRMDISGRWAPVTNLYSSAVFIGWACVVFGLFIEMFLPLGVGNVVAAATGFSSLLIAHGLSLGGDTVEVLRAVLDTTFWLTTHVVCVTLGYSTTFLAGLFGVVYILGGVATPWMTPKIGRELTRITYGVLCFALLFSFIGTVLGGLWADDSWGRFWGWDPKENGALLIVLWNAIALHARWGGMVRDRGLAMLAVGGNVVTAWSWFGVNQLGIGLHSYGFTDGALFNLGMFVLSQLSIVMVAALPVSLWFSSRALTAPSGAEPPADD